MKSSVPRRLVTVLTTAVFAGVAVTAGPVATATIRPDTSNGTSGITPVPADLTPVDGSYIVTFPDSTLPEDTRKLADELTAQYGGRTTFVYDAALKGFAVNADSTQAAMIARDTRVTSVTQDVQISIDALVVQAAPPSWGLDRIDERSLPRDNKYHYPQTAPSVTAYVIDTGILLTHQEFAPAGRAVCGFDPFATGCAPCNQWHGTHVAGTIGGVNVGVAKQVKIVSVKVFNCSPFTTAAVVIAGVNFVTLSAPFQFRSVANMSLGGPLFPPLNAAVLNSMNANVHYSVAAGNNGADACGTSPASLPQATTVAATDINDTRPAWSNFGPCVDLFAPGVNIYSAYHTANNAYFTASGTSMAAPHATGTAAMWRQKFPADNAHAVAAALNANATPNVVINPGAGSPNRLLFMGMIPTN